MRLYDPKHNRLIFINQHATAQFWEEQWAANPMSRNEFLTIKDTYITRITQKYLEPDAGQILEGGCGRGNHVAALVNNGYRCIGVDYAAKTIAAIKSVVPELDVRQGDIFDLPFEDNSFAGYWSVGVIEHFWDGYDKMAEEAARVLAPGGRLFLTFPRLSPLRKRRIKLGQYKEYKQSTQPDKFYQFALDPDQVAAKFSRYNFELIGTQPIDGLKGLKDDVAALRRPLQTLYNYSGRSRLIRGGRYALTQALAPFSGHSALLVMRQK